MSSKFLSGEELLDLLRPFLDKVISDEDFLKIPREHLQNSDDLGLELLFHCLYGAIFNKKTRLGLKKRNENFLKEVVFVPETQEEVKEAVGRREVVPETMENIFEVPKLEIKEESPSSLTNDVQDEDFFSPSLLRRMRKRHKVEGPKENEIFEETSKSANRFGVTKGPAVKTLKQPKIMEALKGDKPGDKNERKTLEEVKPNHERGRPDEAPPAFKYAHSPVRNRLARKQLKGFDCVECKRFYEASTGLTERQRQELMQKCSRHRGRFSPPPNSPQEIWEVNMDRYQEPPTQFGSPLKTRERRRKRIERE